MREKNRFSMRYVVATRTDGRFLLNVISTGPPRTELHSLSVCQNCLTRLRFDGFTNHWPEGKKKSAVNGFSLDEFFSRCPKSLHVEHPTHNSDNAPLNSYTPDFDAISSPARAAANWTCNRCGINLSDKAYQKFLHTHHKNGVRSDNTSSNLEVLCVGCHSEEPLHSHIKAAPDYAAYQRMKWRIQTAGLGS